MHDFPKIESPFAREMVNGVYQCLPVIRLEHRWVWGGDCIAVEKLDGTNVSVHVLDGEIKTLMNRSNMLDLWKSGKWFYEGVRNAIERAYFAPEKFNQAQVFGELVGPKINGNPYGLKEHLWLPFEHLEGKYFFRFWQDFAKGCAGKTDKEIFENTSNLFKGLWSIYRRQHGIKGGSQ
ncbi:MAG: hypothetical protein HY392_00675 [Candidatus Diapherotrites archaeon]|nr:hypothetical protein [Candidatus Diapherotrites archaeon]